MIPKSGKRFALRGQRVGQDHPQNQSLMDSELPYPRHCARSEAIQSLLYGSGLLRFARNDELI
jgi:hypothetical protein